VGGVSDTVNDIGVRLAGTGRLCARGRGSQDAVAQAVTVLASAVLDGKT
jgi:hypothetical protein